MEVILQSFYPKEWISMTEQNKIHPFFLLFFCLILFTQHANGEEVNLKGKAPSYKNQTLVFYTYSDWITKKTADLASAKVNEDGSFQCSFNIDQSQKIFADLGFYKGFLFVEPGNSYNLVLPPKKEKTKAQKLNPYFNGEPYHIGIKNTNENKLNLHIYRFLKEYNNTINNNINTFYSSGKDLDSITRYLDTCIQFENPFFNHYKTYTITKLKITVNSNLHELKKQIFNDSCLHYHNPAYMELFNMVFENYFKEYFTKYDNSVSKSINVHQSISKLDSALKKAELLKKEPLLREFVMLKGLYDAYYDKNFNKKNIVKVLESFPEFSNSPYHKRVSENIYQKITRLREGFKPPDFCLYDRDNNLVCMDSLRGSYIYLGFCNSMNYTCLKHFKILKNLYEKHKNHFRIVIISTEEEFQSMKRFYESKKYPWTVLHYGNQKEILEKYDIQVMPAYFFITPDGKLSLSPAPDPSEKIEWKIFKIMKKRGDL